MKYTKKIHFLLFPVVICSLLVGCISSFHESTNSSTSTTILSTVDTAEKKLFLRKIA